MKAAIVWLLVVSTITIVNGGFRIDSMLEGKEVSTGPYDSSVSVGNLTQKYLNLEPADVKASMNAVDLLERFRRMFAVGIFNLPPLDPFTTNKLSPLIIGPNSLISGKVLINSLTVTGAKDFKLKSVQLRMKTGRADFAIEFPKINLIVDFKTELYLGGLIPLSLKGQLRVQIDVLQLEGALQTEVQMVKETEPNDVYQISGVSVHVQANDAKISLANGVNLDTDLLRSFYGDEERSSVTLWINSTKDMINKYAVNDFISLANNVLRNLSVLQVNAYLAPKDEI